MRFFLFVFLVSSAVSAEPLSSRFSFFGGVSGGYSRVQTDISTEANKNGYHFDLEALASYRFNPVVFDLGFGWIFNRSSGSGGVIVEDTVKTYGPFIDFSSRYIWNEHWQTGLASKTAFGTDFNFGGSRSQTNLAFFAGPQVVYELKDESLIYRFLLSAFTDLNIQGRQVYMALAGFQLGFSGVPIKIEQPAPVPSTQTEEKISTFEVASFKFGVGSSRLTTEEKLKIRKIAAILKKYQREWISILIAGHTDRRGQERFNDGLSLERGRSVKSILVSQGISKKLILIKGFGFRIPKAIGDTEEAWSQNRRVEIRLEGKINAESKANISKEIAELEQP